jgi:hypothetical protein
MMFEKDNSTALYTECGKLRPILRRAMSAEFCVSVRFCEGELLQYRPFLKALFCGQPFYVFY